MNEYKEIEGDLNGKMQVPSFEMIQERLNS